MKKLIILLIVILTSCGPSKEEQELIIAQQKNKNKDMIPNQNLVYGLAIETIDSCEYITFKVSTGACIIHKQNCKNH